MAKGYTMEGRLNYKNWSISLCALLDRIEMVAGDEEAVRKLCQGRFDLAREHGLEVRVTGSASGREH